MWEVGEIENGNILFEREKKNNQVLDNFHLRPQEKLDIYGIDCLSHVTSISQC